MDDLAGELNVTLLKDLLDYMVHEVPAVERSVQTIIAARCLERVADQTINIAIGLMVVARGRSIKHHREQ